MSGSLYSKSRFYWLWCISAHSLTITIVIPAKEIAQQDVSQLQEYLLSKNFD